MEPPKKLSLFKKQMLRQKTKIGHTDGFPSLVKIDQVPEEPA